MILPPLYSGRSLIAHPKMMLLETRFILNYSFFTSASTMARSSITLFHSLLQSSTFVCRYILEPFIATIYFYVFQCSVDQRSNTMEHLTIIFAILLLVPRYGPAVGFGLIVFLQP